MTRQKTQSIYSVREYPVRGATKLVLFFCPFGIKSKYLALPGMPIWHLRRQGFGVVAYSYGHAIATVSVELTKRGLDGVLEDVDRRMATLDEKITVTSFGTSMGTVLAANVAAKYDRIHKVILNMSYSDIADHIIHLPGIRTISTKKLQAYLATTDGEDGLREAFDPYSPVNLVHTFRGKQVLVYTGHGDRVLQKIHTVKLRQALREADIDFMYYENRRGGHYFAALMNYLRYRRWMEFLEK